MFPGTHPMQSIVEGWGFYCEATMFPGTQPMQSIVEGSGFYCETTMFPGTQPMRRIVEGWGCSLLNYNFIQALCRTYDQM